jgi:short-subunit dehydrogenase
MPLSSNDLVKRYGETALITGASSGIGASFARRLAAHGFSRLVLVARRAERLESLKAEIEAGYSNCQVIPISLDLADAGSGAALVNELQRLSIDVDLLVNNAGFGLLGSLDKLPLDRALAMVDLNCRAVVELSSRLLPAMKERKRGAMIITSSIVGALPAPWFSVYAATKSFDLYLGEALHGECLGTGIDVLTVLPGLTRTEFHAGLGDREYHSPYRSAEQVVDTALSALGKKSIVVDGIFNKALVHGSRFLPRGVALRISHYVMRKELGI